MEENTLDALGRGGLSPADRDRAVRHLDACEGCRETLALLGCDAGAAGVEDAPRSPPCFAGEPQRLSAGTRVGRYTVLYEVGSGAMGVVYAAYDPRLDRRVALKLVHHEALPPGSRDEAASRLLREAQALARLSHPGVVAVFDAGRFDDQVFLAMEFVEGGTLGDWLRAAARSSDEVLAAFLGAGRGLSAAHAAGLVHRDVKPDNVLMSRDGRARVTDFGLARFAAGADSVGQGGDGRPTRAGALTQTGALVGTPAYMAPELFRGASADERSDQFSYCVALYEALYGARPFETSEHWGGQIVAKGQKPPRGRRVPQAVQRALARGLSPRPGDRFADMTALLAALEQGRGARRGWQLGLAGAAAVAALTAGLLASPRRQGAPRPACAAASERLAGAWDDERRGAAKAAFFKLGAPHAEATWSATERQLDRYARDWAAMHAEACEATHVRGEQSGELLDLRMACLGRRRAELGALTALLAGADEATLGRAVGAAAALPPLEECASRAALTAPLGLPADPSARAQIGALRAELAEAAAELAAGRYEQSGVRAAGVVRAAEALSYRPLEAEAFMAVALARVRLEDAAAAGPALERALRAAEASGHLSIAARAELSLAFVQGHMLRQHARGYFWVELAGATLERLGDAPLAASDRLVLLGDLLRDEGRANDADAAFERALALQASTLGHDHPSVASTLARIAMTRAMLERFSEALEFGRRSLEASERLLGPDHPQISVPLTSLSFILSMSGRNAEAVPLMKRALAVETRAFGPDHPALVKTLIILSNVQDDPAEAIAWLERARAIQERETTPSQPDAAIILKNLSVSHGLLGHRREQLAYAERSLAVDERLLGPAHPDLVGTLVQLGEAHAALGRPATAKPPLERALAIATSRPATDSYATGRGVQVEVRRHLAQVLWSLGRERGRAHALMLAALELSQGGEGPEMAAVRHKVEAWLAKHKRP